MRGLGKRSAALVVAVAVAMTLAACGSDAPPTHADFRRQVNAQCRAVRKAVTKLAPAADATPEEMIRAGRRALVRQRAAVRTIAAIARPPDERARIARWLALVQRALDAVASSLDAQARIDLSAANQANGTGTALVQQADTEARALGVDDCVTSTPG